MISITQETIGGETVWLILAEPNWSSPARLTVAYETEQSRSRGGVESRRPRRTVPLFAGEQAFLADEAALTLYRQLLGNLEGERVAIPFWPDLDTAEPYMSPQVRVGWDGAFANITISEAGGTPATEHSCPVLVGRLKRVTHALVEPDVAELSLTWLEESPWSQRADIAHAGPSSFALAPDWVSDPEEGTEDLLDLESIGYGREQLQEGDPSRVIWSQSAQWTLPRGGLREYMGWFKKHRGSFAAFTMDAFANPGVDTPQAPHFFNGVSGRGYMRFAEDVLTVDFLEPGLATIKARFVQVLDTASEESEGFAHLFEIVSDADPSDVARLTSYEAPITAGGHTWTPARIDIDKIRSSLQLENDTAEISFALEDVPQVAPVLRHETDVPIRATVYEADLGADPITTTQVITGTATRWQFSGSRAQFKVEPFSGILKRKIPRFFCSRTCNFSLFDGGCQRARPTEMAKSNWSVVGQYNTVFGRSTLRIVSLTTIAAQLAGLGSGNTGGWFDGGWIELGTGVDKQFRAIIGSTYYPTGDGWADAHGSSAALHVVVQRPIRTDILSSGAAAVAYAGCDGTYNTCKNKFDNGQSFGGAPFAPAWIKQRAAPTPTPSK